jgi:hypothetical protein
MLTFKPEVVKLLDLGDDMLQDAKMSEEFPAVLEEFKQFHENAWKSFQIYSQTKLKIPALENLLIDIKEAFEKRAKGIQILYEYLLTQEKDKLEEGLALIEEGTLGIVSEIRALAQEDYKIRFSPFPIIDDLLKGMYNINKRLEDPAILRFRMMNGVKFIEYAEQKWAELLAIHPEIDKHKARLKDIISLFKGSMGALYDFTERKDSDDLFMAYQGLFCASHEYYKLMQEVEAEIQGKFEFSYLPYVERLYKALKQFKEGEILEDKLKEAHYTATQVYNINLGDLFNLRNSPVSKELKERYIPVLEENLRKQGEILDKILNQPELIEDFKTVSEAVAYSYNFLLKELKAERQKIAAATDLDNLRHIIFGVYEGVVPQKYLRQILDDLRNIIIDLKGKEAEVKEEIAEEVSWGLNAEFVGVTEIYKYFEDKNKEHLLTGWKLIEEGGMKLFSVDAPAPPPPAEEKKPMIACLKCGAENPKDAQHCIRCGAYLPYSKMMQEESSQFTFKEGEGIARGTMGAKNIVMLQELVRKIESGDVGYKETQETLMPLLREVSMIKSNLQRQILPKITKEEERDMLITFLGALEEFSMGIRRMLNSSLRGNYSLLIEGFNIACAGAEKIAQFEVKEK